MEIDDSTMDIDGNMVVGAGLSRDSGKILNRCIKRLQRIGAHS